jgi:hypothetical protein
VASCQPSFMFTFPSLKDPAWQNTKAGAGRVCCQILVLAPFAWFDQWRDCPQGARGAGYDTIKGRWRDKCLGALYHFYPKCRGRVEVAE